jgi:hypothetical protein
LSLYSGMRSATRMACTPIANHTTAVTDGNHYHPEGKGVRQHNLGQQRVQRSRLKTLRRNGTEARANAMVHGHEPQLWNIGRWQAFHLPALPVMQGHRCRHAETTAG